MRIVAAGLSVAVMSGCVSASALAAPYEDGEEPSKAQPARLTLNNENDVFTGQDRDYSNGARADYVFAPTKDPKGVSGIIARVIRLKGDDVDYRTGLAIGHEIHTPEDILQPTQPAGQHPYAGYLYGDYAVYASHDTVLDRVGIQLGIIGPSAYGEQVQDFVHDVTGFEDAQGWDNQLRDEVGIKLSYERLRKISVHSARIPPKNDRNDTGTDRIAADFVHHYGIDLGNVATQALLGTIFRYGSGLENDFGPGSIHPGTGAAGVAEVHTPGSLYGFVGVTGRAVAQNIFLDGNTDGESFSVEREPFVVDVRAGFVLQRGPVRATVSLMLQGKEFETQDAPHGVGAISLSFGL